MTPSAPPGGTVSSVRGALRRLRPGDHRPVRYRPLDRPPDRPAETAIGDGQCRAVRTELARRLRQGILELTEAVPGQRGDRLRRRPGERPLRGQPVIVVDDRDDHRGARPELVTDLVLNAAVQPVPGELADQAAGRRADEHGPEQGRGEQADRDADAAAPAESPAPQVIAGLRHPHPAAGIVLDQDHAFRADRLVPDQAHERVEIPVSQLRGGIRRHDHAECVAHRFPRRAGRGITDAALGRPRPRRAAPQTELSGHDPSGAQPAHHPRRTKLSRDSQHAVRNQRNDMFLGRTGLRLPSAWEGVSSHTSCRGTCETGSAATRTGTRTTFRCESRA